MDISLKFPRYLSIDQQGKEEQIDRVIEVVGHLFMDVTDPRRYIHSKGYVDGQGIIWVYQKKKPKSNRNRYPYFWIEDGVIKRSTPRFEVMRKFNVKNSSLLTIDRIVEETRDDDKMYNEQAVIDMNNSSSKYTPIIKDDDDYLKKIIKTVILAKNIDLSRIKCKMENHYNLMNMKQALEKKTKMSVPYFAKWAEILGIDFTIIIEDNHTDRIDPLPETLVYNSAIDTVLTQKDWERRFTITLGGTKKKKDILKEAKEKNYMHSLLEKYAKV